MCVFRSHAETRATLRRPPTPGTRLRDGHAVVSQPRQPPQTAPLRPRPRVLAPAPLRGHQRRAPIRGTLRGQSDFLYNLLITLFF